MDRAQNILHGAVGDYCLLLVLLMVGCTLHGVVAVAASSTGPTTVSPARPIPDTAVAYDLKEIPTFEAPAAARSRFLTGAITECRSEPDQRVKRYPAFTSSRPLYGSFHVGSPAGEPNTGYDYAFALDESAGQGYDRIYLDTSLNGDLTDDPYRVPMKDVPAQALFPITGAAQVCFEIVKIRVTPDDDSQHRLEVMPRFMALAEGPNYAMLMTTKAHTGAIRVGGIEVEAVLGHAPEIPGWFDHPATGLFLLEAKRPVGSTPTPWYGGGLLMDMHQQGDTYYRFAATPGGDKLFVWPYAGPFGTLKIASGGRQVRTVSASGPLGSQDATLSLTQRLGERNLPASNTYRLPVRDYAPLTLGFSYDALSCMVMRNIHADGQPRARTRGWPQVYGIQIRADKPFVLDLSTKPQVLFALPARDQRVKRGGQVDVKAVLIDPSLDAMFRYIREGKQLDPKVVIKRANGAMVAEDVMPFG